MCSFVNCTAAKDVKLPSSYSVIIFYGNYDRDFETKHCNFIECSSEYLLFIYARVVVDECSFIVSTPQNFTYILNLWHDGNVSLTITQSYIDEFYVIPSNATIFESRTLFINHIPKIDFNICSPSKTPPNTKFILNKLPYYFPHKHKKYQNLFRFH